MNKLKNILLSVTLVTVFGAQAGDGIPGQIWKSRHLQQESFVWGSSLKAGDDVNFFSSNKAPQYAKPGEEWGYRYVVAEDVKEGALEVKVRRDCNRDAKGHDAILIPLDPTKIDPSLAEQLEGAAGLAVLKKVALSEKSK